MIFTSTEREREKVQKSLNTNEQQQQQKNNNVSRNDAIFENCSLPTLISSKRNQNLDWIAFNPDKIELNSFYFIPFWLFSHYEASLSLASYSFAALLSTYDDGGQHIICIFMAL